jgi:hypothetical protein
VRSKWGLLCVRCPIPRNVKRSSRCFNIPGPVLDRIVLCVRYRFVKIPTWFIQKQHGDNGRANACRYDHQDREASADKRMLLFFSFLSCPAHACRSTQSVSVVVSQKKCFSFLTPSTCQVAGITLLVSKQQLVHVIMLRIFLLLGLRLPSDPAFGGRSSWPHIVISFSTDRMCFSRSNWYGAPSSPWSKSYTFYHDIQHFLMFLWRYMVSSRLN